MPFDARFCQDAIRIPKICMLFILLCRNLVTVLGLEMVNQMTSTGVAGKYCIQVGGKTCWKHLYNSTLQILGITTHSSWLSWCIICINIQIDVPKKSGKCQGSGWMECSAPMAICIVNHGPKLGWWNQQPPKRRRWAAATAAKVCESNSTNQHQHWRSGPHWWVPKFHMFSDVYIDVNIDLFTFL